MAKEESGVACTVPPMLSLEVDRAATVAAALPAASSAPPASSLTDSLESPK